mmetsp:Transcript_13820/g.57753  ORF Transcript_13820/g.57753 Transcript_13820/m.57753 type:complete len:217 (-) Transcript_13820:191-841(-)
MASAAGMLAPVREGVGRLPYASRCSTMAVSMYERKSVLSRASAASCSYVSASRLSKADWAAPSFASLCCWARKALSSLDSALEPSPRLPPLSVSLARSLSVVVRREATCLRRASISRRACSRSRTERRASRRAACHWRMGASTRSSISEARSIARDSSCAELSSSPTVAGRSPSCAPAADGVAARPRRSFLLSAGVAAARASAPLLLTPARFSPSL